MFFQFQSFVYQNLESDCDDIVFENLHFKKHLTLSKLKETTLRLILQNCSGEFEIWADSEQLLSGKVTIPEDSKYLQDIEKVDLSEDYIELQENEIYDELRHRGYNYTGSYRVVKSLLITDQGKYCSIISAIILLRYLLVFFTILDLVGKIERVRTTFYIEGDNFKMITSNFINYYGSKMKAMRNF